MSNGGAGAASESRCEVTIIVPSYQPGHYLFDCLKSLAAQRTSHAYEVIVVDSSPEDITPEVKRRFPQVKVIHLPQRAFPGTARNVGIAQARGEVLAFTDADCVVAPDWVQRFVERHSSGMMVVGGPVVNGTPDSAIGSAEFLLEFNDFQADRGGCRRVALLPTCNVAYRRELFRRFGGFDGAIKGSDSAFSRRMNSQGVELYLVPGIFVAHRNRTSLDGFLRNQFQLGIGSALTRRKLALRDSFVVRAPLFVPLIPLARTVAIGYRLLRWSPKNFVRFVVLYPLIFLGLLVFTAGFVRGLAAGHEGGRGVVQD
ncbi:MAG: glycosyltransferase [bacterium]|jgi:GT2 family glycosyltransferase|nr:glycosyltransferase [candidate division KSB1 bacterium]MDH7559938.1 glycosyltransferase [bacterium]